MFDFFKKIKKQEKTEIKESPVTPQKKESKGLQQDSYRIIGIGICEDEDIYIRDDVLNIGENAFKDCIFIKRVWLPKDLKRIYPSAFENCTNLEQIFVPSDWKPEGIGDEAFKNCRALTELDLPYTGVQTGYATRIGNYAFAGCCGLTSVNIGARVEIEDYAFAGCCGLTSVNIYNNKFSNVIRDYAFAGCDNIKLLKLVIGNSIGRYAFTTSENMEGIWEQIPIEKSYKLYYKSKSANCDMEDDYFVGKMCEGFSDYASNPLYRANALYFDGRLIKYLAIPEGIHTIGRSAFPYISQCLNIEKIFIPMSVMKIEKLAFEGGSRKWLREKGWGAEIEKTGSKELQIHYGGNIRSWCKIDFEDEDSNPLRIADGGFFIKGELVENIIIPEGITEIKQYAFSGCWKPKSITLPETLKTIGDGAFCYPDPLEVKVFYKGTKRDWEKISIGYSNFDIKKSPRYYYSENSPSKIGLFWHYDEDGFSPVVW